MLLIRPKTSCSLWTGVIVLGGPNKNEFGLIIEN